MSMNQRVISHRFYSVYLVLAIIALVATPLILKYGIWPSLGLPSAHFRLFSELRVSDIVIIVGGIGLVALALWLMSTIAAAGFSSTTAKLEREQQCDEEGSRTAFWLTAIGGILSLGVILFEQVLGQALEFHLWDISENGLSIVLSVTIIGCSWLMRKDATLTLASALVFLSSMVLGNSVALLGAIIGFWKSRKKTNKREL